MKDGSREDAKARSGLTPAMEAALLSLYEGHPFGILRVTEMALYNRRLAYWVEKRLSSRRKIRVLALTRDGWQAARGLRVQQLAAAGAVPVRHGFAVIDGGKPDIIGRQEIGRAHV